MPNLLQTQDPNTGKKKTSTEIKAEFDSHLKAFDQGGNAKTGPGFVEGFNNTMQSGGMQLGLGAISGVSKATTAMNTSGNQTALGIRDSISDAAINSGIPIAMAIGAATKVVDAIGDATGFHLDNMDKDAAKRAGVSGGAAFLNNAVQALPGFGPLLALTSPNKTHEARDISNEAQDISSGYEGTMNDINAAKSLGGKRTFFGIGQNEMNSFIDEANRKAELLDKLGHTNALAKKSTYYQDVAQQNLNRYAGTNYQMHAVGKNGMKIASKEELQKILSKRKFQNGGVIGTDTNLIPDGSLHARLNHLQDTNPDLEDTTKKGIPVLDENGDQVAEIECNEIVLRLELTEKIEKLAKDGSEEAMIECGKLLVNELLNNTQDNTGALLEDDKNGK